MVTSSASVVNLLVSVTVEDPTSDKENNASEGEDNSDMEAEDVTNNRNIVDSEDDLEDIADNKIAPVFGEYSKFNY